MNRFARLTTFQEWTAACEKQLSILTTMQELLNEGGKEKRRVFDVLVNLASFCGSAKELVDWINSSDEDAKFSKEDRELLGSVYAMPPINRLKKIAELEVEEANKPAQTFYVSYKIDARFIAEVKARTVEEALKEAELRFQDANFGEAEDIQGNPVIVENEAGDYVWEK